MGTTAREPVDMVMTDWAAEMSTFPRIIDVIVRIVAAGIVTDPAIVGVDVRRVWMTVLIAKISIARGIPVPPAITAVLRRGRRTVLGNVPASDIVRGAALRPALIMLVLREPVSGQQ